MRTKTQHKFDSSRFPRPGVIKSIAQYLEAAGEHGRPLTKDQILDKLVRKFPERSREAMSITVTAQLSRLPRERGIRVTSYRTSGQPTRYAAFAAAQKASRVA